jgi:hypothetical protein
VAGGRRCKDDRKQNIRPTLQISSTNMHTVSRPTKGIARKKISWNNLIFALISFKNQSREFTAYAEITQKGQNTIEYIIAWPTGK